MKVTTSSSIQPRYVPQSTAAAPAKKSAPVDSFEAAPKAKSAQAATAAPSADWNGVMAWKSTVEKYAKQYGVPPNLVFAVMKIESNGGNLPENSDGAVGPMQITSDWDGFGNRFDPTDNVRMGCEILRTLRDEHPDQGWDGAVCSYFSGSPYPSDKSDGYNTVRQYLATVKSNEAYLDGLSKTAAPSGAAALVLKKGDRSDDVKHMQTHLASLGYMDPKKVQNGDGLFGPGTEAAVKQFQHDHGLPETGKADLATRKAIRAADKELKSLDGTTLQQGQTSEAVRKWQSQLVKLGYMTQAQMDTGPGVFGPKTEAATKRFQTDHHLNVSGKVGSATHAAMNKAIANGEKAPKTPKLSVPYINQLSSDGTADDWNEQYNCGPTTMAMIAKAFGFHRDDWKDGTLVNFLGNAAGVDDNGAGWPQEQQMAQAAGLTASAPMYGDDLNWVRSQLAAGKLIAANGDRAVTLDHASFNDGVTGGHWIVVTGVLPDGNFSVLDPSTDCKELSPSELQRYFDTRDGGGVAIAVGR